MLSIYEYTEPHEFLRDLWDEKRVSDSQFTLRSWAKQMGLRSHTPLYEAIRGKRKIRKEWIPPLAESLGLKSKECLYLENLVSLSHSKNPKERVFYTKMLRTLAPKSPVKMKEVESYRLLRDPIHTIILEMTVLPGFRWDVGWIQDRLESAFSHDRIASSMERLIELELVRQSDGGQWMKAQDHLYSKSDVTDLGLQEYHQKCSNLAIEAIATQDPLEREFNAVSLNVKREAIPKAKKVLREFLTKFIKEIESESGKGDETYHLNLQFFGLTRNDKRRRKK